MELLPVFKLGWLNGWILLASFYLIFGLLMLVFPKVVVKKLYSVSGWSKEQRILSVVGKPFALACLVLIILTPLKVGRPVFVIGTTVFVIGFVGMMIALFNFASTPVDQPVIRGLYRISRNPQWINLVLMLLGSCITIGSWTALFLLLIAVTFYHFRILGEERACLKQYGDSYRQFLKRVPRYLLFL